MRNLDQWLGDYAVSHQNPTNRKIHTFCVPAIMFSIVAFLWNFQFYQIHLSYYMMALVSPFYIRLGLKATAIMAVQLAISVVILLMLPAGFPLFGGSIALFVVAWVGQFIGHKIEGKKPSFFEDLKFLLVGPLWVVLK